MGDDKERVPLDDIKPSRTDPLAQLAEEIKDPITFALAAVRLSKQLGDNGPRLHFGARRSYEIHQGIDLLYEPKTQLNLPLPPNQPAFLIGKSEGGPLGYAVVLFVPDRQQPYFLLMAHLDKETMEILKKRHIDVGSKLTADGSPFVSTGASGRAKGPHLHMAVTTGFVERIRRPDGTLANGRFHTAEEFMRLYHENEREFMAFLNQNNFPTLLIPKEHRDSAQHRDPLELIDGGKLVLKGTAPKTLPTEKKKPMMATY